MIGVFNRSHYEDVIAVRVRELEPRAVWSERFERINQFEELLAQDGTIVLKFFLHISRQQQERRLLARERAPEKAWKLSVSDWEDRARWDDYLEAYEDVLRRCSTHVAPWYVVQADRKWFRNLAVASAIVKALRPHKDEWLRTLAEDSRERIKELRAYHDARG